MKQFFWRFSRLSSLSFEIFSSDDVVRVKDGSFIRFMYIQWYIGTYIYTFAYQEIVLIYF